MMTTTMRMSVQCSLAQKSSEPRNDECAFSFVRRRCCDSRNVSGSRRVLSHRRNPSKLRVFRAAGARGEDCSVGNGIVATKIIHNSALRCTIVVAAITLPRCSETYLALPYVLPYLTTPYILPYPTLYLTFCHTLHLTIFHLKLHTLGFTLPYILPYLTSSLALP